MSRNGPAPQRNLHRPDNAASRDRQAPPNLQQGPATIDPRHKFFSRGDSSSDSSLRYEQAVDEDGRRPRFTVQQPALGSSTELGLPQNPKNLTRLSPIDARTALVDRGTTSVSKVSHPACLIPGYRATPQQRHQVREQVVYASSFPSASAGISDAELPSLVSTTVQLFHPALPSGFNAGNDLGGNCRDSHVSTTTVGGTTPGQHRLRYGPTSEGYHIISSTQGTESRSSTKTRSMPTDQRTSSRTDTVQEGARGVLTSEQDGTMWENVVLRNGYRLHDTQHHPEISQVANLAARRVTAAAEVPEDVIHHDRRARGRRGDPAQIEQQIPEPTASADSASISSTETQSSTTPVIDSSFPSLNAPPPPRVSCDLVARNAFLAANIFHFEPENVGREDIIANREESTAVDCGSRAETCARRVSLRMQVWEEQFVDNFRYEMRTIGLVEIHER